MSGDELANAVDRYHHWKLERRLWADDEREAREAGQDEQADELHRCWAEADYQCSRFAYIIRVASPRTGWALLCDPAPPIVAVES